MHKITELKHFKACMQAGVIVAFVAMILACASSNSSTRSTGPATDADHAYMTDSVSTPASALLQNDHQI